MGSWSERGSISLLILGFALVLILAIVGITAVSEVYLTRRSLASVADGAALAGAQSVDQTAVVLGEPGTRRRLDPTAVAAAVATDLDAVGAAGRLTGFDYSVNLAGGGTVVVVTVHARSRIGIASALFDSTTVTLGQRAAAVAADR